MSVAQISELVTLRELADRWPVSKRWLQLRVGEGMPSEMLAGKRVVRPTEVETWLRRNGHWREG